MFELRRYRTEAGVRPRRHQRYSKLISPKADTLRATASIRQRRHQGGPKPIGPSTSIFRFTSWQYQARARCNIECMGASTRKGPAAIYSYRARDSTRTRGRNGQTCDQSTHRKERGVAEKRRSARSTAADTLVVESSCRK